MNQKVFHDLGPEPALMVSWTPRSPASLWERQELTVCHLSLGLKIKKMTQKTDATQKGGKSFLYNHFGTFTTFSLLGFHLTYFIF